MVGKNALNFLTSVSLGLDIVSDILLITEYDRRWQDPKEGEQSIPWHFFCFGLVFLFFYPVIIGIVTSIKWFKHQWPWAILSQIYLAVFALFFAPIVGIVASFWKLPRRFRVCLTVIKLGEAVFESFPQLVLNCIYMTTYQHPGGVPTIFSIVSMVFSVIQIGVFILHTPCIVNKDFNKDCNLDLDLDLDLCLDFDCEAGGFDGDGDGGDDGDDGDCGD